MTRTLSLVLVVLSLVVLGGAWLASRAITADVSVPLGRAEERPQMVTVLPPPPSNPVAVAPVLRPVAVADPTLAPVVREPPPMLVPVAATAPEDPESPYAFENSPEVERAWQLTFGPDTGPGSWRNAVRVFRRCLAQVPGNPRCQQGLAAAQDKLEAASPDAPAEKADFRDRVPRKRGHHDNTEPDEQVQGEAVQARLPLGVEAAPRAPQRLVAVVQGFSLHAGTWVHGNDRQALERLASYGARGPVAESRLTHLTTFYGPASKLRARVVRAPVEVATPTPTEPSASPSAPKRPRLDWATLQARTFGEDVWAGPCGGRRKVLAVVTSRRTAEEVLQRLGLLTRSRRPRPRRSSRRRCDARSPAAKGFDSQGEVCPAPGIPPVAALTKVSGNVARRGQEVQPSSCAFWFRDFFFLFVATRGESLSGVFGEHRTVGESVSYA